MAEPQLGRGRPPARAAEVCFVANQLWPALANGRARVISVSSRGHKFSPIQWDDLQFERGYDKWKGVRAVEDGERPLRR